jgi:membrane associated rhomboid family serine protease
MIVIASFGRVIRMQFGNRIIWWLYLLGALAGGLAMNFGMPQLPMVVPQVGSDAAISAMLTFYGLFNLRQSVILFLFPVPMWVSLN